MVVFGAIMTGLALVLALLLGAVNYAPWFIDQLHQSPAGWIATAVVAFVGGISIMIASQQASGQSEGGSTK